LHQRLQAEGAVGAAAVLDEYLLAEPLGQVLGARRAMKSVPPPAGNGTIILIDRCGQLWTGACAPAAPGNATASASVAASLAS
jgi:hypothetical protein